LEVVQVQSNKHNLTVHTWRSKDKDTVALGLTTAELPRRAQESGEVDHAQVLFKGGREHVLACPTPVVTPLRLLRVLRIDRLLTSDELRCRKKHDVHMHGGCHSAIPHFNLGAEAHSLW